MPAARVGRPRRGGFVKPRHLMPLLGFVIPRSCIAGLNELTVGFATTVAGACVTYWLGLRAVLRDTGGR